MFLKKLFIFTAVLFSAVNLQAIECSFVAKENGQIVKEIGDIHQRHSPASTFKVPIALMGFDAGILLSFEEPVIEFSEEIAQNFSLLYQPEKYPSQQFSTRSQTPATWMKYSVVWYSQEITKQLGLEKFTNYLTKFNYGNKDVSGTPGKNDGLIASWLDNSLLISPLEQAEFMEKLCKKELPLSLNAQESTIKLIELDSLGDDWKLYGKTGTITFDRGWFIGWVEKGGRQIHFAQYLKTDNAPLPGGRNAKEMAKDNLISLILPSN